MRQSPVKCSVKIQNEILGQNRGASGIQKKVQKVATEQHQRIKTFGCFYKCLFSTKERAKVEKKR